MKTLPTGLSALAAVTLVIASLGIGFVVAQDAPSGASAPLPDDATVPATVGFGMDAASVAPQRSAGVAPDYGTFWVGPWTLASGWGGPDGQLTAMKDAGVTPAIHFYYWGDDISQSCLQNGCWSTLHNAQKTQAGWQTLATQLVQHLDARMGGEPVVIFLETEFNKADVQTYEPLDAMLAQKAAFIKEGYPQAHVVLALGTWNTPAWKTWDRAAAASDSIGIQSMRGSTRDTRSHYDNAYEATLAGARTAQATFGKPVFVTDVALSSYPEPEYLDAQAKALGEFFTGLPDLKAAGVHAIIYRSWRDSPNMDLANYYGQAERHWGLAYAGSGVQKAAGAVWVAGVLAERANGAASTPPPALAASFVPSVNINEWWVDVRVTASNPLARVEASVDGGAPHNLPKTAWGTWAASFHVPRGSMVTFRAVDVHGQDAHSSPVQWLGPAVLPPQPAFSALALGLSVTFDGSASKDPQGLPLTYAWTLGDGRTASGAKVSTAYAAPGTYAVTLTASNGKLSAASTQTVTVTQPNRAPTAAFTATAKDLTATFDGTGSTDPDGDALTYAWSFPDGTKATGAKVTKTFAADGTHNVQLTVSDGRLSHTASQSVTVKAPAPAAPFTATFTPSTNVNPWWVDVRVASSAPATRVEATVDGGAPHPLYKTSWGTWAASFNAPRGSTVVFRAYAADGQSAASDPIQWLGPAPASPTFTASFTPKAVGNDWWVETKVSSSSTVTNVQARVNGGMWTSLTKTPYDSYARSIYAPDGAKVEFRATSSTGATAMSPVTVWR